MRLRDDDKSQVGEGVEDDDDTRRRVLQVKDKRWLKKKKEREGATTKPGAMEERERNQEMN